MAKKYDNVFLIDYYFGICYGYTTDINVEYYYGNANIDIDLQ